MSDEKLNAEKVDSTKTDSGELTESELAAVSGGSGVTLEEIITNPSKVGDRVTAQLVVGTPTDTEPSYKLTEPSYKLKPYNFNW